MERVTHTQIEDVQFSGLIGTLPAIAITSPTTDDSTVAATLLINLGGTAADAEGIAAITIVSTTAAGSLATGTTVWTVPSSQPILVERAQYWPFTPDRWYEAHNAFGSTAVGFRWGLAEARVGGPEGYQTFILLAGHLRRARAVLRLTGRRVRRRHERARHPPAPSAQLAPCRSTSTLAEPGRRCFAPPSLNDAEGLSAVPSRQ